MSWLSKLIKYIRGRQQADTMDPSGSLPPAMMVALAGNLATTEPDEVSCGEVDRLMDEFAELAARGEDASRIMPLVQLHFNHCPECREELEALLVVLNAYQESMRSNTGG